MMKTRWLVGICVLCMLLASCGKQIQEPTETQEKTEMHTTYPAATLPLGLSTGELPQTYPPATVSVHTDTEKPSMPIPKSDYIDEFHSFMLFPDRYNPNLYHKKPIYFPGI